MEVLLAPTQVASWLGVAEKTVARMAKDGRLPKPLMIGSRSRFSADCILPQIVQDRDAVFAGGLTLKTHTGPIYFEMIKPQHKFYNFGEPCALFEDLGGSWHLRPWRTAFVFDIPDYTDHPPVILSCEDNDVENISRRDLPPIYSAHVQRLEPFDASARVPRASLLSPAILKWVPPQDSAKSA